jgi:glycosyltransferase involved in cell wall biosynthesis
LTSSPSPARKRLKVLYVINGLGTGGAERSLFEMLPVLERASVDVTLALVYSRKEGVEERVRALGSDMRFLPSGSFPSRIPALRRLIRENRPDLVHTTIFESDVAGRIAAAGTGVPVLTSLVNASYEPIRRLDPNVGRVGLEVTRLIDAWTARHLTTHFHAITHAVKESAIRTLGIPKERITVIERGRDPRRLGIPSFAKRSAARKLLELEEADQVLLTVGRQEYQKGQRYLLEAMEDVVADWPNAILLVAGRTGHATPELQRLHEASPVRDRVRFLGHRDDVPTVLAAADVFVFPSLYEGLGGSVIEAMALGLPIVASDIPALAEVVERDRNAILVPPADPAALTRGIRRLLLDPQQTARYGQRSREIFEDRFTLEQSASRLVDLYRSLCTASGAPAGVQNFAPRQSPGAQSL